MAELGCMAKFAMIKIIFKVRLRARCVVVLCTVSQTPPEQLNRAVQNWPACLRVWAQHVRPESKALPARTHPPCASAACLTGPDARPYGGHPAARRRAPGTGPAAPEHGGLDGDSKPRVPGSLHDLVRASSLGQVSDTDDELPSHAVVAARHAGSGGRWRQTLDFLAHPDESPAHPCAEYGIVFDESRGLDCMF
jgi:hypothetical protein